MIPAVRRLCINRHIWPRTWKRTGRSINSTAPNKHLCLQNAKTFTKVKKWKWKTWTVYNLITRWKPCWTSDHGGSSVAHNAPRCALERYRWPLYADELPTFPSASRRSKAPLYVFYAQDKHMQCLSKMYTYFVARFGHLNSRSLLWQIQIKFTHHECVVLS